jgi:hypothetical protein
VSRASQPPQLDGSPFLRPGLFWGVAIILRSSACPAAVHLFTRTAGLHKARNRLSGSTTARLAASQHEAHTPALLFFAATSDAPHNIPTCSCSPILGCASSHSVGSTCWVYKHPVVTCRPSATQSDLTRFPSDRQLSTQLYRGPLRSLTTNTCLLHELLPTIFNSSDLIHCCFSSSYTHHFRSSDSDSDCYFYPSIFAN